MNTLMFAYEKELFKLLNKKKYYVITIIGILISVLRFGGSVLIAKLSGGTFNIRSSIAMEMLPISVEIIVPLILFIAVSDLFTNEYASDTMKSCLMQPVNRFNLLTVKAAAALTVGVGSLIVMYIVNMIIQTINGVSPANAPLIFLAYVIDIIPLIGIVFLGIIINVLLRSPVSATLLCLALYAVMKYAGIYVSGADAFLFTSIAKLHALIIGTPLPFNMLMCKLGILFGSILILYSVSYILFEKRNF